jgi:hypothetical protein
MNAASRIAAHRNAPRRTATQRLPMKFTTLRSAPHRIAPRRPATQRLPTPGGSVTTRSKYGAKPQVIDGIRLASKAEAKRYGQLRQLEMAGAIRGIEMHPVYQIIIDGEPVKMRNGHIAKYTADFRYFEGEQRIIEEVKGYVVRDYPLRRAIIEHIYKVKIREVRA